MFRASSTAILTALSVDPAPTFFAQMKLPLGSSFMTTASCPPLDVRLVTEAPKSISNVPNKDPHIKMLPSASYFRSFAIKVPLGPV